MNEHSLKVAIEKLKALATKAAQPVGNMAAHDVVVRQFITLMEFRNALSPDLILKLIASHEALTAAQPTPVAAEPDAELVHYTSAGGTRDHWDIRVRNKSLKNGTKLYAHPAAVQRDEQERDKVLEEFRKVLVSITPAPMKEAHPFDFMMSEEVEREKHRAEIAAMDRIAKALVDCLEDVAAPPQAEAQQGLNTSALKDVVCGAIRKVTGCPDVAAGPMSLAGEIVRAIESALSAQSVSEGDA
jgi:hypothetical protein